MGARPRYLLLGLGLALALGVVVVVLLVRSVAHRSPPIAPQFVPPSWEQYRTSLGHEQHVGKATIACKDCHDYETAGFVAPAVQVCARCHDKETQHTHSGDEKKKTDCLTCHSFAPGAAKQNCMGCHADVQHQAAAVTSHRTV